jgi:hypothetical protein
MDLQTTSFKDQSVTLLFSDKVDNWIKQKKRQKATFNHKSLTLKISMSLKISDGFKESKWDSIVFSSNPDFFIMSIYHRAKY